MSVAHIRPAEVETFSLDWGTMKWFVSPVTIRGEFAISEGDTVYIPMGTLHSTWHPAGEIVGWQRTAG
jgi:mannose-6-phosphate isomerase-like protein (cupin superfamily)